VTVNGLTTKLETKDLKVCPYNDEKLCIQIDNVKELRELIDNTAKEVKGVGDNVENMNERVNDLSEGMRAMMNAVTRTGESVTRIGDSIDKVFKLHFDKALSDKDEFSELNIKIEEVSHKSEIDNLMQNSNIKNEELDGFKERRKDKKSLWQKAQMTAVGIFIALIINGLIDVAKDIFTLIKDIPK